MRRAIIFVALAAVVGILLSVGELLAPRIDAIEKVTGFAG